MKIRNLLLTATLLCSGAAHATTMARIERTCPVGGAKYPSFEIMSTSSFGVRLDLRRLGPQAFLPYVECPNGFIVFKEEKDFTADEIAKLTPVVASTEFQDAFKNDVPSIRLILLKQALGSDPAGIAYFHLKAAFEAEDRQDEPLRQKHLGEAAEAYAALLAGFKTKDKDWWLAEIRSADIARQRGHFPEAMAAAEAIQAAPLPDPEMDWFKELAAQIRAAAAAGDAAPKPYKSPE